jgi:hypothetical protein
MYLTQLLLPPEKEFSDFDDADKNGGIEMGTWSFPQYLKFISDILGNSKWEQKRKLTPKQCKVILNRIPEVNEKPYRFNKYGIKVLKIAFSSPTGLKWISK